MNTSTINIIKTEDCIVLGRNATIPWDNPNKLISAETYRHVETVKCVILLPILYIIGAPANIINMVVFFKQGLNERINLCLFLLALVDFIFLTFILMYRASSIDAPFTNSGLFGTFFVHMVINNAVGLYGFSYASMLISTVIATERCVCILFPLKAQRCIPTRVFAFSLFVSLCVVTFLRFVVTAKYGITCFLEERTGRITGRRSVNDYYLQNREMLDILDGVFYGFFLTIGCLLITFITTVITAIKLRQIIQWRDHSSSAMSSKEIGITKMLVCLSIEFLVLSIPHIVMRVLPMFEPELSYGGDYANTFAMLVSVAEVFTCTSSGVNFFVYYFTGSRFRETLHHLLNCNSLSLTTDAVTKPGGR